MPIGRIVRVAVDIGDLEGIAEAIGSRGPAALIGVVDGHDRVAAGVLDGDAFAAIVEVAAKVPRDDDARITSGKG